MKKIQSLIIKTVYSPSINWLLRPISLIIYKLFKKRILSVAGKLNLTLKGKKISLLTNQTCSVTNALYYESAINYEFTPIFIELIQSSKVFYDIGANIGFFSVVAKKFNPAVQVIAFEPNNGVFNYLEKNIQLNETAVSAVKAAVSDQVGQLEFYSVVNPKYPLVKENLSGSHSLQNEYGISKAESYIVDVTTLLKTTNNFNIDKVDLMKLDTECTEHIILLSSIDFIIKHQPIIICEVYHMIMKDMIAVMDQLIGFKAFQCYGDYLKEVELSAISDSDPERNFFFCPIAKIDKIKQFIR